MFLLVPQERSSETPGSAENALSSSCRRLQVVHQPMKHPLGGNLDVDVLVRASFLFFSFKWHHFISLTCPLSRRLYDSHEKKDKRCRQAPKCEINKLIFSSLSSRTVPKFFFPSECSFLCLKKDPLKFLALLRFLAKNALSSDCFDRSSPYSYFLL